MNSPPRVSIAVPVRNAGPWLEQCLNSIAAQTEPSFELLAVDDGSTDSGREILEVHARQDSRIRVLRTVPGSGGIVGALNLALKQAQAPLLARMDADDVMHPDRLRRQADALDADPGLFAVASQAAGFPAEEVRDGMRAYLDWQNSLLTPEEIARDRFVESPVLHPSVMVRTEVARRVLDGWQDTDWPEDWDFFLRAFENNLRVGRLPDALVEWRLHPGQLTRTHPRYRQESLLAARAHFLSRHLRGTGPAAGRDLWVLGAGPVGKGLIKALARAGMVAQGLADVDPRKVGGIVRGDGHRWPVVAPAQLRDMAPRPFAVSAVSGLLGRERVRGELGSWGWKEGDDYLVAA